jgi:hypothetical protein
MLSGGAGSWGAARRTVERHGHKGLTLLFADTLIEDDDLYRFVLEAASNLTGRRVPPGLLARTVAIPSLEEGRRRRRHLLALAAEASEWCPTLEWIAEGRDPHHVFEDKRYLGNTSVDPCSAVLKRTVMRRWLEEHRDPATTVAVIGYDWSEIHRLERAQAHWAPWRVEAPLCEAPYLSKEEVLDWMGAEGLSAPREVRERELRRRLGKDVSILRDRRGGVMRSLTLHRFRRERTEWGASSCMEPAPAQSRTRRRSKRLRNEEDRDA